MVWTLGRRPRRRSFTHEFGCGNDPALSWQVNRELNGSRPVTDDADGAELAEQHEHVAVLRQRHSREPGDALLPCTVGQRIENAATQDSGLALGRARIGQVIDAFLAAHPNATDEEVVRDAARHHNPGNPLADTVWGYFQTIHAARAATPAAPGAPAQGAPAQGGPAQGSNQP